MVNDDDDDDMLESCSSLMAFVWNVVIDMWWRALRKLTMRVHSQVVAHDMPNFVHVRDRSGNE